MGIVSAIAIEGYAIGTLLFWSAAAAVAGIVWLVRKLIKRYRTRTVAKAEGNRAP